MRNKGWSWGLAALAACFLAAAAPARGADKDADKDAGRKTEASEKRDKKDGRFMDKLGLDDATKKKLKEHRKEHRAKGKALREALQEKRKALRAELEKTDLDEAKVKAAAAELKDARDALADHMIAGILEVRKMLTAEQFKKFQALRPKKEGRGPRWGGRDKDL